MACLSVEFYFLNENPEVEKVTLVLSKQKFDAEA